LGTQVQFLSPKVGPLFRANANIVIQELREELSVEKIGELSEKQLQMVLNEYELLAKAFVNLGNLKGLELRGRYKASDGNRIIRSFIGLSKRYQVVFTFTCTEEKEPIYIKTVHKMIHSFQTGTS